MVERFISERVQQFSVQQFDFVFVAQYIESIKQFGQYIFQFVFVEQFQLDE